MIYLDHASSSQIDSAFAEAAQAMLPRFFANPNAHHMLGYEIDSLMQNSRKKIADCFGFDVQEVFFTASGSEAVNLAIKGIAIANQHIGKHIITVATEHHCALNSMTWLHTWFGHEITMLSVDRKGKIDLQQLQNSIRQDTVMVVIMAVNNEIATIHPIPAIQQLLKQKKSKAVLVVDAIAAVGKIDPSLYKADVMAFSQHKLGGISGSGCLLKRRHIKMEPLISGGQQEQSKRAGTPFAIANILFGDVITHAIEKQRQKHDHMVSLRDHLIEQLCERFNVTIVSNQQGSPYIVSFIQPRVHSSIILNVLSQQEVFVSSHSACASDLKIPSHVLMACGYRPEEAFGMIRVSFHYHTSKADIDGFIAAYEKVSEYVQ